jgi:hypothetical protein
VVVSCGGARLPQIPRIGFRFWVVSRRSQILERELKESSVILLQVRREIDQPTVSWSAREIVAIPIWAKDIGIRSPIWVTRPDEPIASDAAFDVVRPTCLDAKKRDAAILGERPRHSHIQPGRKVGIDIIDSNTIEELVRCC